jgi:hypothetical protein
MKNYSLKKTIIKVVKYLVLFVLPILVDKFIVEYPQIAQLTIGGLLILIVDWLKHKVGIKLP